MIKSFRFERRIFVLLLLFVCAAIAFQGSINAQTTNENLPNAAQKVLSVKDRAQIFDEVWETISEKYYSPKFNGADWNAVREQYRPRLDAVKSDSEFYDLLNQMVGELRDAHTRVRSPRQRQERKNQQSTNAGVFIYEVENKSVVVSVAPDSEAARAGVLPGMIVPTVGGKPIAEALAEVRRDIGTSSSERATRLISYSRLIAGEPDTPLKLGLTRADGTPFDVTLMRRTVSAAPQFTARLLPSGDAYIKFNRFLPPVGKQFKEALIKFKNAPALIIDLRSNGGGDGELGLEIAGYFFNEQTSFAKLITRTGKPPSALFGLFKFPLDAQAGKKGEQIYANPVVILVNEGSASTSELFTGGMQEQNRAQVIGTQSCGCVLGILGYKKLKDGGDLAVSEIGFVTAKGRTLEGNGITPDKTVLVTLADLQSGRDTVLEAAEQYFSNSRGNE